MACYLFMAASKVLRPNLKLVVATGRVKALTFYHWMRISIVLYHHTSFDRIKYFSWFWITHLGLSKIPSLPCLPYMDLLSLKALKISLKKPEFDCILNPLETQF
ncbi:unnamed protein product [Ceratitis capitata]|uniref:(Mediterranean fruit fly) hypothetical protein n=1 Tax=Ceratitis capitata TaxID=7213 RepID=A0A811VAG8_CERCA|nr:unnamed protein product [Ceratitis capitata]